MGLTGNRGNVISRIVDYELSVFVPEILRARNSVNIMQIRERNEEGMALLGASPLAACYSIALINARNTLGKEETARSLVV